jgi:hypothetical protein
MSAHASHCVGLAGVFAIAGFLASPGAAEEQIPERAAVQLGLMNSLFRGAPDSVKQAMLEPFRTLMESQTGIKSELETAPSAHVAGRPERSPARSTL